LLQGAEQVFISGLLLQEMLQGFAGLKNRVQLVERFSELAFLQPTSKTTSLQLNLAILAAVEVSRSARLMPCSSNSASAMN